MIINKRNKPLILFVLVSLFFCLPLFADILTDQTLQNDLNYYRKTYKLQKLGPNDRSYILLRIKEKYEGTELDTSAIDNEIALAERGAPSAGTAKTTKTSPRSGLKPSSTAGKVEKIFVSETKSESKIFVAAQGVSRSNYFLMKDPDATKPLKIVLDLYGVKNKLSQAARDISPKEGLFSNVLAVDLEGPPNNVVRVTAELRESAPYTVKKEGSLWVISASKKALETEKTDAAAPIMSPDPSKVISPAAAGYDDESDIEAQPAAASAAAKLSPSADYRIENSDILGVTIYPADELSREVIVQPDGNISFPLIGSAKAQGLTIKQLENSLSQSLGKFISEPQATITVKQFSRRQIFITGEVKGVGAYNFKENLRLLEFISSIGGFTESANRREVKIYRGPPTKRQTYTVNVEEIVKTGDFSKDFLLETGDIIEVQKGQAKVSILGDIKSPGYYDFKDNMHLVELISLAGGFTDSAKINDIRIIHSGAGTKQTVSKVNLNNILSGKEKDVLIQRGDTVYLPKGKMASANWFINNFLPWLSLISLVFVIRAGI